MKKLAVLAVLFIATTMTAQRMNVVKGDFGFLKGQKEINVEFDYSKLTVMPEKKAEADYISERKNELNEKSKGNGDSWAKKWEASKSNDWSPKFTELINTVMSKEGKDFAAKEGATGAKYTLIVECIWFYPGYNVMIQKKGAKVTTTLKFVETANRSNVLLEITSENAPGDVFGGSFSNEDRIAEGFAKTGKSLAKLMMKNGI